MKFKIIIFILVTVIICPSLTAQTAASPDFQIPVLADSLFNLQQYKKAAPAYEEFISRNKVRPLSKAKLAFCYHKLGNYKKANSIYDQISSNPNPKLKPFLFSRMAMTFSMEKKLEKSLAFLDSAVANSYIDINELNTATDFDNIRKTEKFKLIYKKAELIAYPCMSDPHAREFDFWIGEWNVYQTGTNNYAGHSLIQLISGGCALLENWDSQNSTGKSINFIDPVSNKWKQSWSGSYTGGNQEFVDGEYKDSAMRFTFETTDAQGKKLIGRFIFFNEGPDQVRQFNETSADSGKTWTTNYDFTYKRKK